MIIQYFLSRVNSIKNAGNGLNILVKEEHNARIHLVVTLFVIALSLICSINQTEWILILFCITLVWAFEAINTVIEKMGDIIVPDKNQEMKKIKDLSAFAVLAVAFFSIITGSIIFIPKLLF